MKPPDKPKIQKQDEQDHIDLYHWDCLIASLDEQAERLREQKIKLERANARLWRMLAEARKKKQD